MKLKVDGFDWDSGNRIKCEKHGVSLHEMEELFKVNPMVAPSPRRSGSETRFLAVGRTGSGRAVFVAFAIRSKDGQNLIRPVSARYMHRKEAASYEKEDSETQDGSRR